MGMELSCSGWGTFPIQVEIQWKGGGILNTQWMLRFDDNQFDFYKSLDVPAEVAQRHSSQSGYAQAPQSVLGHHGDVVMDYANTGDSARSAMLDVLLEAPAMNPGD